MTSIVHNADCLAAMREMPDKAFDLAIVDPPYGTFDSNNKIERTGGSWSKKYQRDNSIKKWDFVPPQEYFDELFRVSKNQIIWGANYFTNYLPANRCFLIWEKETISEAFSMAMVEYAWASFNQNAKLFKYRPQDSERIHPTQKPIALYQWLLKNYAEQGWHILDTHVGSGSSRIACDKFGCHFTGYEIDKDYWEAQEKRFADYKSQTSLFVPGHFLDA